MVMKQKQLTKITENLNLEKKKLRDAHRVMQNCNTIKLVPLENKVISQITRQ